MHDRIGVDVLEPVIEKIQLILAKNRVGLDKAVHGRTKVLFESGHANLGGLAATTDSRSPLEHENAEPGLGEIRGGDQTVVPGARHDKIKDGLSSPHFRRSY